MCASSLPIRRFRATCPGSAPSVKLPSPWCVLRAKLPHARQTFAVFHGGALEADSQRKREREERAKAGYPSLKTLEADFTQTEGAQAKEAKD